MVKPAYHGIIFITHDKCSTWALAATIWELFFQPLAPPWGMLAGVPLFQVTVQNISEDFPCGISSSTSYHH
ncbi:unnamed protein product [Musa hybrid cultivar]